MIEKSFAVSQTVSQSVLLNEYAKHNKKSRKLSVCFYVI